MIGGEIVSDLDFAESDHALHVPGTTAAFLGANTVLTFGFNVDAGLVAKWYRFDPRRRAGELLWRHDCHTGHEDTLGGPHHLHIGPEEDHRIPAEPATLEQVAAKSSPRTSTSAADATADVSLADRVPWPGRAQETSRSR